MNARTRIGDWIQTYTGKRYWPLDPDPAEVDIADIAHALSMQCRYTGHCRFFYSVAEHSVHVSYLVPAEHAFAGLMHDAPEAYLTDVAKPVKRFLNNYHQIEDLNWRVIAAKYGLHHELPREVHDADYECLVAEQDVLMPVLADRSPITPRFVPVTGYDPRRAKDMFLKRFDELYLP